MERNAIIISAAISLVFVAAIASVVQMIPIAHAWPYVDHVCDHFDVDDENSADDIFTASSIEGHKSGSVFDYAEFIWSCGSGGNHIPKPSSVQFCIRKYQDTNYNWFGPYTMANPAAFQHDVVPYGMTYTY